MVAKTRPKLTARAMGPHISMEGAPVSTDSVRKSTLIPRAMGSSPSTVVMAVSITGRKRTTPARCSASRRPRPPRSRSRVA